MSLRHAAESLPSFPKFCYRSTILFFAIVSLAGSPAKAGQQASASHWVTTFGAAAQLPRTPLPAGTRPIGDVGGRTVRMIVHTTLGGSQVRVELSNLFGTTPLKLAAAHVALRRHTSTPGSAIDPASDRALLFNHQASVEIPAGAAMISDPVALAFPAQADLAVSIYTAAEISVPTTHFLGLQTEFVSGPGDFTSQPELADAEPTQVLYWVSRVDVLAPAASWAIVTLGDSITDGTRSTPDANRSWPSVLSRRLVARPGNSSVAVVNEGIAGNRILHDSVGPSALSRFDRDVLALTQVRLLFVLEGINDIQVGTRPDNPIDTVSAQDVIGGLRQIIERAHLHGIRVIGCTLTPFQGAASYSSQGESSRESVNQWIRTSGAFDAVVDFEKAVRDPADPKRILSTYDSGDHLHPNDAGYQAMADSIDLNLLKPRPPAVDIFSAR